METIPVQYTSKFAPEGHPMKNFSDLTEREMLAVAISSEDEEP